jgi:amidohydrolase
MIFSRLRRVFVLLRPVVYLALAAIALPMAAQAPAGLDESAQKQLLALTETYKHLHENPELSKQEGKTAAFVAGELRKLGYTVTEHVGKYEDGTQAEGVVAIMENGGGSRLLLRTELDALPVEETTGLDYASHVKTTNAQGQAVSVMHACGHDLHMTVLLGAARELAARKSQWHGTLMLIGQPAEEMIVGAAAMLRDH